VKQRRKLVTSERLKYDGEIICSSVLTVIVLLSLDNRRSIHYENVTSFSFIIRRFWGIEGWTAPEDFSEFPESAHSWRDQFFRNSNDKILTDLYTTRNGIKPRGEKLRRDGREINRYRVKWREGWYIGIVNSPR